HEQRDDEYRAALAGRKLQVQSVLHLHPLVHQARLRNAAVVVNISRWRRSLYPESTFPPTAVVSKVYDFLSNCVPYCSERISMDRFTLMMLFQLTTSLAAR